MAISRVFQSIHRSGGGETLLPWRPIAQEEDRNVEDKDLKSLDSEEAPVVPWYLQVESPRKAPRVLSERQKLPELPESPPPILQPLLQQLSVDLGLDDLSLIDLRKLDPPPALGANLLMLFGTTRSEKHLHVSADRLCRWLRSTYKLRPDADGLLGRNELKLKLRRKSRRAKLLGASDENSDDGIRTGWVCVDVGIVESPAESAEVELDQKFVGFGRRTDGIRIVVQMLTEEKREELELEKLWGGILRRATQQVAEDVDDHTNLDTPQHTTVTPSQILGPTGPAIRRQINEYAATLPQLRGFHTSTRRMSIESEVHTSSETSSYPFPSNSAYVSGDLDIHGIQKSVLFAISSGNFDQVRIYLQQASSRIPQLNNEQWRPFLLEQLRFYLESLPKDLAVRHLGHGWTDRTSTAFLESFYDTLSSIPSQSEWETRIKLFCYASEIDHHGYSATGMYELLNELRHSGVALPAGLYLRIFHAILRPKSPGFKHNPRDFRSALKVLQTMNSQGINMMTEKILVTLQEILAEVNPDKRSPDPRNTGTEETFDCPDVPMSPPQFRLHLLMKVVDMPCFSDEAIMRLLDLYAQHNHWKAFWDVWRSAPQQGQPRSAALYAFMFNCVAKTNNQKACTKVLRSWIPDMDQEVIPVEVEGEVGEAIKACLRVVDQYAEGEAMSNTESVGEWFVIHFVGDIHQPLHNEALDVGGNSILVTFGGIPVNLHALWDTNMPEKLVGGYSLADALTWANILTAAIQTGAYQYEAASWLTGMALADPITTSLSWAAEANAYVCSTVLPDGVTAVQGKELNGTYYESAVPVIQLQIARAGYRLAAWLDLIAQSGKTEL
ncbi:hypothetical protein B7494_g49 [Chlorociboria aeruginascens]|nr:hypothetical protein B7494_g49 [Chlorociboria aeruginascens]